MTPSDNNTTQAAITAGMQLALPRQPLRTGDKQRVETDIDGTPFAVLPAGSMIASLEHLLPKPTRKRGKVTCSETAALITYLNKHAEPSGSMIYAEIDSEQSVFKLVAVIDDHQQADPRWRDHICILNPELSVEWKRWTGKDGIRMSQAEFASWLEDNRGDVATAPGMPDGAQILEMALGFEATAEKRMRSKINTTNGGFAFEYVDQENDDTRTTMKFYERFTIGVPVFRGSTSAYPIEARLKYRNKSGELTFWFELVRPDKVFAAEVSESVAFVAEETGLLVIAGSPGI